MTSKQCVLWTMPHFVQFASILTNHCLLKAATFFPWMTSAYKGQLLMKSTFSGSLGHPLHTGATVLGCKAYIAQHPDSWKHAHHTSDEFCNWQLI